MEPTKSLHAYALACCKVGKEIWRRFDSVNYPCYVVSNMGRIRKWIRPNRNRVLSDTKSARWKRKNTPTFYGKYNKPTYGSRNKDNGYVFVMSKFMVHRLVASAYIPNPENKPTVDHDDRNRSNNRLDNLKWATHAEQAQNRSVENRKTVDAKHSRKVWKVDPRSGERLELYNSVKDACKAVDGKSQGKISDIASSRKSTHGKYPEFMPKTAYDYKWEWCDIYELEGEEWKDVPPDVAIKDLKSGAAEARRTRDTAMKKCDKLKHKYKLSNYGRLYDVKENKLVHGSKTQRNNVSFGIVMENGETWRILDNVITALIWLPPNSEPIKKSQVNHKDGNPSNCHVSNLEWSTREENVTHAYQNGLMKGDGWTEEEDRIIIETIKMYGDKIVQWKKDGILDLLNNRSTSSCSGRRLKLKKQLEHALKAKPK
jgi:hypothetical protein